MNILQDRMRKKENIWGLYICLTFLLSSKTIFADRFPDISFLGVRTMGFCLLAPQFPYLKKIENTECKCVPLF